MIVNNNKRLQVKRADNILFMKPTQCHKFYEKAMHIARKSTMRQQHGCVIVYNNKEIVAEGYNHTRNNNMKNIKSTHAEMEAIKQFRHVLAKNDKNYRNRCTLYVVRIGSGITDANLKQSSPCRHCAKAINSVGIPRVCYSVDENKFTEEYFLTDKHKTTTLQCVSNMFNKMTVN
jgi:tRNA(Arg) A34 adenosine deaminase TadA